MRRAFALLFAASGAAALIYEVTWTRLFTLQLGHGVAAVSTVLAAFMGGLAVGSAAAGRRAVRLNPRRSLRVYGGLELAIAFLALLLPFAVNSLEPLFALAYGDGGGGPAFALLRVGAGLLLLSLPAAAMGATFPIASRWFVPYADRAPRDAGVLYAANTIGAALGALVAGFILLPQLGLSGATWTGVALNVVAAAGAWWIAARREGVASAAPQPGPIASAEAMAVKKSRPPPRARRRGPERGAAAGPITARPYLAAAALGISGFASLTLQVVWTRVLAMILGPTTYAFSTMVGVFIAGLAVGSAIGARLASSGRSSVLSRQPAAALALWVTLSAAASLVAASLVDRGLLSLANFVAQPDVTFEGVVLRQALVAFGLLAPMTIAFGLAFPFAVALAAQSDERVSSDLGLIYAVNTAGAIAGALLSGFVLISWLGLHGTIRAIAMASAVGAVAVLLAARATGKIRAVAFASAIVVIGMAVWLPRWDPLLLSSGAYKYAPSLRTTDLETALRAGRLLYYREGPTGTVAVRRLVGFTSLAIDGKVDASNSGDMLTQRLLAHVPLLLHPNPKRVAILGLGSGVTLGSALRHPVERADVLEISPEVAQASRFFESENHHALTDPRTRLILGDGRSHLLLTRDLYDVIVSEPSNPWMAGIASLFTKEFFEAAQRRLAPGGVLCQWAHTYDITTDDLKSIVATFLSVFPDGTLWLVGDGDVLLIGSSGPLDDRLAGMSQAWERPGVKEDLASVGATEPFHLLSMLVAEGRQLEAWSAGAPIQTDDRTELEFSGPHSIFGRLKDDNSTLLRQLAAQPGRPSVIERAVAEARPSSWRDRGWMLYQADGFRPAHDDFVRAVNGDPRDASALDGLLRTSAPLQRGPETRALLVELASDPSNTAAKLALARLLASEGNYEEAARITLGVVQADPRDVAALEEMASILSDVGDRERMAPIVAKLRAEAPDSEGAHYYAGSLLFLEGRTELALQEARAVLARNPRHAKAHNLVGACLASLGQRQEARAAFEASLAADPKEPATYANLGTLELESGNPALAAGYFAEALTIDPTSAAAREGLEKAKRAGI